MEKQGNKRIDNPRLENIHFEPFKYPYSPYDTHIPCPFCGKEDPTETEFFVQCKQCLARGPMGRTKDNANAWNGRVVDFSRKDK